MGVAGLWDVLKPAGTVRSLTDLAIKEGFEANPDGKRGFRLGIDASIWFFHAEYGREGENPVLRTLFFRCATLMHTTFLPIFVFDGPKRPDVKRGKKINRTSHKLIPGMKQIVEAFGFEWRMAPGEAEAELAYLNRIGVIDGILSDDVDNFLFGATMVIRNSSNTLSGNRSNPILNSAGKDDKNHTRIFTLEDITNNPDICLTRGGMILIGLMSGGDYQQGGLMRCGVTTAHGLAKCGFGDSLYEAAVNLEREDLEEFLVTWREGLRQELRTNSQKAIGRKQVALAKSIPEDFPDIDILLSYVKPITSESMGRESNNLKLTWSKEPDVAKLAAVCEFYFEWGYKEAIIKRFRTVMWHSIVLRILRRAVLDLDSRAASKAASTTPTKKGKGKERPECGTPSKMIAKHFSSLGISASKEVYVSGSESQEEEDEDRLIVKVHSSRTHASTDGLHEYRLEIAPRQLVRLAETGIQGTRVPEGPDEWASEDGEDDDGEGKKRKREPIDPETHLRLWMPACMVKLVEPKLVKEYEDIQEQKLMKKTKKGSRSTTVKDKPSAKEKTQRKKTTTHTAESEDDVFLAQAPSIAKKTSPTRRRTTTKQPLPEEEEQSSELEYLSRQVRRPSPPPASRSKLAAPKNAPAFIPLSDEEDPYEYCLSLPPTKVMEPGQRDDALLIDRMLLTTSISSPVKPRTGIKDLTKKKKSTVNPGDMKTFFSVTHSATATVAKKPTIERSSVQSSFVPPRLSAAPRLTAIRASSSSSSSSSLAKNSTTAPTSEATSPYDSDSGGEYDVGLWNKNGPARPYMSPTPKRKTQEKGMGSLFESDRHERFKKSPRKNATHTSPKSRQRPTSPSPSTTRTLKKYPDVVEISDSDSDDGLPSEIVPLRRTLPPLLLAKARSAKSNSSSSQNSVKIGLKSQTSITSVEVIDLT